MYDAETIFNLYMNKERLSKFLIHYELFKKIEKKNNCIVECGVFKGTSFSRFAMFRELFKKKNNLIAFDNFSKEYPNTKFKNEKTIRQKFIKTAGHSISTSQLKKIFKKKKIKNFELIKGDVLKTIPKFKQKNQKIKISLLNIDIDFIESTLCVLENFYDNVEKGGIIIFDNYAGKYMGEYFHGETSIIDNFLKKKNKKIRKFGFFNRPSYIVK
jgi:hypothetical protein